MSAKNILKIAASVAAISAAAFVVPAIAQKATPAMKASDTMMKSGGDAMKSTDSMKSGDAMKGTEMMMKNPKHIRITFQNLTTGQGFSPSVFVSHATGTPGVFKLGDKASDAVVAIAEGGNIGPLSGASAKGLGTTYGSAAATIHTLPGQTRTVEIDVDAAHPLISGVWMLGMTNDGFSGIDDFNAYALTGPKTIEVRGYDAGSEKNNEKKEFMAALGGQGRDPEDGVITYHTGIRGDADAPAEWKFDPAKPVARITITPVTVKTGS